MFSELVDVKENGLVNIDQELLCILLKDRTTNKNIIWATDMYEEKGNQYLSNSEITINAITGYYGQIIKPRTKKSKKEQMLRSREKAEVFTPSWICNEQNNIVDDNWFGYPNVFNIPHKNGWKTNGNKIMFCKDKNWIDYVKSIRLEISCGEAPYLVSRYDSVTGEIIPTHNRIGLLDRKLRIINENAITDEEWNEYVEIAYKSIYGYEWQGDSLLIARENLLYTYTDYYYERYNKKPSLDEVKKIAEIISWNIFQMDGMKFVIPNSCKNEVIIDYTIFGTEETRIECHGCKKDNYNYHNGIYVKIMNWETNRQVKFISLLKGRK